MQIQRTRMKNDTHKILAAALQVNLADGPRVKKLLENDNYKYLNDKVSGFLVVFYLLL